MARTNKIHRTWFRASAAVDASNRAALDVAESALLGLRRTGMAPGILLRGQPCHIKLVVITRGGEYGTQDRVRERR
jgi:hypothetical protein